MEFIPNSHDFHWHAHPASKSKTRRASDNHLQSSRVRQKINDGSSTWRVGWRCVCPVFSIEQPHHELKRLSFSAQLVNPLFFSAQNIVCILHNCPFVARLGNHMPCSHWHWLSITSILGESFLNRNTKGKETTSYDSSSL
jgi:hypothetical protein